MSAYGSIVSDVMVKGGTRCRLDTVTYTVESQRAGDINGHHSSGCVDSVIQARKSASPRATGRATMQGVS